MADVSIRKGDRLPQLDRQFLVDGSGVNLTGATVVFNMYKASDGTQVITDGTVTVVTAALGDVRSQVDRPQHGDAGGGVLRPHRSGLVVHGGTGNPHHRCRSPARR